MASESIQVSALIPGKPEQIYRAWLDGAAHAKMTGADATGEARVGARHSSWGGYISGEVLELDEGRGFVQSWRASDFPESAADSILKVSLEAEGDGTRVTIDHLDLPEDMGASFTIGWEKFYFTPMKRYFGAVVRLAVASAKRAATKPVSAAAPARPAAKKAPTKLAAKAAPAAKKAVAKKAVGKKAVAKKAVAKKAIAKKPAAKAPRKAAARKPAARKAPARKKATRRGKR